MTHGASFILFTFFLLDFIPLIVSVDPFLHLPLPLRELQVTAVDPDFVVFSGFSETAQGSASSQYNIFVYRASTNQWTSPTFTKPTPSIYGRIAMSYGAGVLFFTTDSPVLDVYYPGFDGWTSDMGELPESPLACSTALNRPLGAAWEHSAVVLLCVDRFLIYNVATSEWTIHVAPIGKLKHHIIRDRIQRGCPWWPPPKLGNFFCPF